MARPNTRHNKSKQRKAKARERRKRVQKAREQEARSIKGRLRRAGRSPLRECLISTGWRERHYAQVLIARDGPQGIAAALFLVDLGCLGVKNTIQHDGLTRAEYQRLVETAFETTGVEPCRPELAVRVVETGVRYAADLGFEPHPDYRLAREMFGDVDPNACDEEVPCGRDGRPFYVEGPDDDVDLVLRTLEDRLGPDGFHFVVGEEGPGDLDEQPFPGDDDPDPDERLWGRMRRAEGKLVADVLRWGAERLGRGFLDRAKQALTFGDPQGLEEEIQGFYLPWALFDWTPTGGRPLGMAYLEENEDALSELEARFLEAVCARPFSFHVVRSVDPGVGMDLRDLFTGAEYTVRERQASRLVGPGDTLFARVLRLDSVAILVGCGSVLVPPELRASLVDVRERLAGGPELLAEEELASHDGILRDAYFTMVRAVRAARTPALQTTDGDPLVFCKLAFDLRCSPSEALSLLRPLAHADGDDAFPAEATYDERGELESTEFAWTVAGNRVHAGWTNTVVGHVSIAPGRLVVEVNSRARATRALGEVERLLGARAEHRSTEEKTPDELLDASRRTKAGPDARRRDEERAGLEADPAVQAEIARMMEGHWDHWLDTEIPMLAGQTPREAARSATGRERLEALFDVFAEEKPGQPAALRPDVARLRAELGM